MSKESGSESFNEVCLLDIPMHTLFSALSDPETATLVGDYKNSSVLERIDELMNLYEAPVSAIFVNSDAVSQTRKEWTVQIPEDIYKKIMSFGS